MIALTWVRLGLNTLSILEYHSFPTLGNILPNTALNTKPKLAWAVTG